MAGTEGEQNPMVFISLILLVVRKSQAAALNVE